MFTAQALQGENRIQNGFLHVDNEDENGAFHFGNGFQSVVDVPVKTETEMVIEPMPIAKTIFDLHTVGTDDMVYLFVNCVFIYLRYLNSQRPGEFI